MLSFRAILLAALLTATSATAQAQNQDRFRVAILNGQGAANVSSLSPAFAIDFGPQTKNGSPEEFAAYKQSFGTTTVYPIPGNELVASMWAKEGFTRTFQRPYRSFDFGEYHFVLLDSITRSSLGHLDNIQLKWLDDDLKKMKKNASAVVFMHHPVDEGSRRLSIVGGEGGYVDNEDSLLRVLAPHTVAALFCANGDRKAQWTANGIPCFAVPDPDMVAEFSIGRVRILKGEEQIASLPRQAAARRRIAFAWDDANMPLLARRQFLAELRSEKKTVRDDQLSADYRIDERPWTPMEEDRRIDPSRRDTHEGRFMARFETKGLGWGGHRLQIRMKAPDGELYRREEPFVVEELHGAPKRAWEFDAGEGVAAGLTLAGNTLVACTLDGKVIAVDTETGKKRWTVSTKGPIYAAPVESNGTLYVASTDHALYAIDTKSGHVNWRFEADAPLVKSPLISGNSLSILSAGRTINLVDGKPSSAPVAVDRIESPRVMLGDLAVDLSSTGELTWTAGSDIRRFSYHLDPGYCLSRPVADNKKTYAASLNGTVYAISLP